MSQNSCQPEGLPPESAAHRSAEQGPRLRGCDRGGGRESRGCGALPVALRGRIQARNAWNLLRPPRDAALLVLPIERLLPSPGALPSPILAATHTCFIMLGTLRFPDIELSMPAAWRNLIVANASAHRRLIPMLHDGAESVQPSETRVRCTVL